MDPHAIVQKLCQKGKGAQTTQSPEEVGIDTKATGVQNPPEVFSEQHVTEGSKQALDIYVTQEFVDAAEPSEGWARIFSGDEDQLLVRVVEADLATVVLSANSEGKATFTLSQPACIQFGLQTLPVACFDSSAPNVYYIIRILAPLSLWNWHFQRMPESRPYQSLIDLEFLELRHNHEYTVEGMPIFEPEGSNLIVNGVVDFVVSYEEYYGIRVVNRSTQDIYARMFFFSPTSLTIHSKTIPMLGSDPSDPTLPRNASLTIGYGSEGQLPIMFGIDEGLDYDVTFLKLFVSNRPIDIDPFNDHSPFDSCRCCPGAGGNIVFEKDSMWDEFTVTLVQRRYPKGEEPAPT